MTVTTIIYIRYRITYTHDIAAESRHRMCFLLLAISLTFCRHADANDVDAGNGVDASMSTMRDMFSVGMPQKMMPVRGMGVTERMMAMSERSIHVIRFSQHASRRWHGRSRRMHH